MNGCQLHQMLDIVCRVVPILFPSLATHQSLLHLNAPMHFLLIPHFMMLVSLDMQFSLWNVCIHNLFPYTKSNQFSVESSYSYLQQFVLKPFGRIVVPTQGGGEMKFIDGPGSFESELVVTSYIVGSDFLFQHQWYDSPVVAASHSCDHICDYTMSTRTRGPGT